MNKKAMSSQVFIGMITVIVIGVIIAIGFSFVSDTTNSIEEIKLNDFADKLMNDIERTAALKAVKYYNYDLPAIADKIIIIDDGNVESLLKNEYIKTHPIIADSIESGEGRDLFIVDSSDNLIKSFDIGDISVGQFGDERCSGIAVIDMKRTMLELRISRKGSGKMFIGEDCEGLKYTVFRGPFDNSIFASNEYINRIERIKSDSRIVLRQNNDQTYLTTGSGYSKDLKINGDLDRFFFDGFTPEGTEMNFQLEFDRKFVGPDMTNNTFYTYNGQYISSPEDFNGGYVKVKFNLHSNEDKTKTPYLEMIRLSYYE